MYNINKSLSNLDRNLNRCIKLSSGMTLQEQQVKVNSEIAKQINRNQGKISNIQDLLDYYRE